MKIVRMYIRVNEVSELHDTNNITDNVANFNLPLSIEVRANGSASAEDTYVGDDVNKLVNGLYSIRKKSRKKKKKHKNA